MGKRQMLSQSRLSFDVACSWTVLYAYDMMGETSSFALDSAYPDQNR